MWPILIWQHRKNYYSSNLWTIDLFEIKIFGWQSINEKCEGSYNKCSHLTIYNSKTIRANVRLNCSLESVSHLMLDAKMQDEIRISFIWKFWFSGTGCLFLHFRRKFFICENNEQNLIAFTFKHDVEGWKWFDLCFHFIQWTTTATTIDFGISGKKACARHI